MLATKKDSPLQLQLFSSYLKYLSSLDYFFIILRRKRLIMIKKNKWGRGRYAHFFM